MKGTHQKRVNHWKDFGKDDGGFSEVLVQDSNLGLVGGVLDQCGHHRQDKNLRHLNKIVKKLFDHPKVRLD